MGRTIRLAGGWIAVGMIGIFLLLPEEARAQSRRGRGRTSNAPRASAAAADGFAGQVPQIPGFPATFNTPGGNAGFSGDPLAGAGMMPAASLSMATASYRARHQQAMMMSNPANWPRPTTPQKVWHRPAPTDIANQAHIEDLSDEVVSGYYTPGTGVNMGFATPEFVYGGVYLPGYGVNNGFGGVYNVVGGTYVPGLGVVGGWDTLSGVPGVMRVQGGLLIPGFGVVASPNLGTTTVH